MDTNDREGEEVEKRYIQDFIQMQAYADDQVALIAGTSAREIETKWKMVWSA